MVTCTPHVKWFSLKSSICVLWNWTNKKAWSCSSLHNLHGAFPFKCKLKNGVCHWAYPYDIILKMSWLSERDWASGGRLDSGDGASGWYSRTGSVVLWFRCLAYHWEHYKTLGTLRTGDVIALRLSSDRRKDRSNSHEQIQNRRLEPFPLLIELSGAPT